MSESLWLDKLRSVPVVGLRFVPIFKSGSSLLDASEALILSWHKQGLKPEVLLENATTVRIRLKSGFDLSLTHEDFVCTFNYKAKMKVEPGKSPDLQLTHAPAPFSSLVEEAIGLILDLCDAQTRQRPRELARIGLVSQTTLDSHALPPGVSGLLSHIGKFWGRDLDEYNAVLSVDLTTNDRYHDRCHHTLRRQEVQSEDKSAQVNLDLDWQRVFESPPTVQKSKLSQFIQAAKEDAVAYYERFGRGDLIDE